MDPLSLVSRGPRPEAWQLAAAGGGIPGLPSSARAAPPGQSLGFAEAAGLGRPDPSGHESTVTEQSGGCQSGGKRKDLPSAAAATAEDESSRLGAVDGGNASTDYEGKRLKVMTSRDENDGSKAEAEASSGTGKKHKNHNAKVSEAPKQDFIHVRARRGQATDSHSLAERARREKISERMKILQDLVPGCNKIIGKASILDEIINYIQSLQCQVEFLSMKLEAVTSQMNSGIEEFPSKDFDKQICDTTSSALNSQGTREYERGLAPDWLHMQIGGAFERVT